MPDLTYQQLKEAVALIAKTVAKDSDKIREFAKWVEWEAIDTARLADRIGAMHVDPHTVGETRQLSKIMAGLSDTAIEYASAGDTTSRTATAANHQAHRTHDGIQEAFRRSPVDLSEVDREWLRQE